MTAAAQLAPLLAVLFPDELPVRIIGWDGSSVGPAHGPAVRLTSRRALRRLLWAPGELGLAQAYVAGDLEVEGDLADGLRRIWAAARDGRAPGRPGGRELLHAARPGLLLAAAGPRPRPPGAEARLAGMRHSKARDRAAIAHHYDLSNDFYRLLLDPQMAYSCAYWTSREPGYTLADAQRDKLDLVCRKLGLRPGMRLLDVGCGWGALVLHAAEHYGVHATGITLSGQQHDLARARIAERGLAGRAEVRLQDYREIGDPPYDRIASLEMGEHVGAENYPRFARRLFDLLVPTGRLLLQQMSRGPVRPGGGAFIEAYVAPDMHMRPLPQTLGLLAAAGFEIRDVHALREHYARTVSAWQARLEDRWDEAVTLIGPEQARVWRLYLTGGMLAFEENRMGVEQVLAVRPTRAGASGMPEVRDLPVAPADPAAPAAARRSG